MHKIIALSGSHCVGKTTLITALEENFKANNLLSKYKFYSELNTGFYNMGYPIAGIGYDLDDVIFGEEQVFIAGVNLVKYHLNKKNDERIVLLDRSFVDTFLYTEFFIEENPELQEKYKDLYLDMKETTKMLASEMFHILVPTIKSSNNYSNMMSLDSSFTIWKKFQNYFKENIKPSNYLVLENDCLKERLKETTLILDSITK